MRIKKVTLQNFRIYKGENTLVFPYHPDKNMFVVSGYNGFGKTTFLTSLVWCLYGKQMQEVDRTFRERIVEAGGYKNYLASSLNKVAKSDGENEFSVSLLLEDVNIPEVTINELEIIRTCRAGQEELMVRIDGAENELVNEVGNDFFIQDFVLPKEIAKFFFFDAEKITSLAEIKSLDEKRQLSKAYSEVLGIKKYEDLKYNLLDLRGRYKKASANEKDKVLIEQLEKKEASIEFELAELEKKVAKENEQIIEISKTVNDLQEKLFREGHSVSLEKLRSLRKEKEKLEQESQELKHQFQELLDLAPFAMVFGLVTQVEEQVKAESTDGNLAATADIKGKLETIQQEFAEEDFFSPLIDEKTKLYLKGQLSSLLHKHFAGYLNEPNVGSSQALHAFSPSELQEFGAIVGQLKTTYKFQVKQTTQALKLNQAKTLDVNRQLNRGESKESDIYIQKIREEKSNAEDDILQLRTKLEHHLGRRGVLTHELNNCQKQRSEVEKRVRVNENFEKKDGVAARLVGQLESFVRRMKEEKRVSLENKILSGLQGLMHKQNFVAKVCVEVTQDLIDILLYDQQNNEIPKEDLSKGEQQLYATAILKALVEESHIEFPVFIDSPLQKFDAQHAANIIRDFYPYISKQVVILPLLKKEISYQEYEQMLPKVEAAFLIENVADGASHFRPVHPARLFEETQPALTEAYV